MIYYLKLVILIKTQNQKTIGKKRQKRDTIDSLGALYDGREMVLNAL